MLGIPAEFVLKNNICSCCNVLTSSQYADALVFKPALGYLMFNMAR